MEIVACNCCWIRVAGNCIYNVHTKAKIEDPYAKVKIEDFSMGGGILPLKHPCPPSKGKPKRKRRELLTGSNYYAIV